MTQQVFSNNADGTLLSAVTAGAVTLTLSAGQGARFPALVGGDWFVATLFEVSGNTEVNIEIVKVTARNADVLTVVRAQEGTTAKAYPSGARVSLRITAEVMNNLARGGAGGPSNPICFEHDTHMTQDYTIKAGKCALIGYLDVDATLTIEDGGVAIFI